MARREFLFDDRLAFENPVHGGIEIVLVGIAHSEDFGQCGFAREGDEIRMFLRLRRKKVVTVHYNTHHFVRYASHGSGRASSASYATRIAEIEDAGTAREKEMPIGDDHGFLWRLNSYWRFQEAWGGIIVELESVSLSRVVPAPLRWLVGRYLDSVPRESIAATLEPIRREAPRTFVTYRPKAKLSETVGKER